MHGELGLCPQPSPNSVKDEPIAQAHQSPSEILKNTANKTHGRGANTVAKPATNAVAPTVPNLLYIAEVNSGNTDPKQLLKKLLLASTDAAMGR